jgi:tuftelin-interacting protein 11
MKWVQEETASGTLTAGDLICKFKALKERCPQEYAAFRLADAARAVVAQVLRSAFRRWEPLKDPSRGLNTLRHVLLAGDGSAASLVGDAVVEAVRAAEWNARDYGPMFLLVETWAGTLPPAATRRVLEEVVAPRLAAAVEEWEPRWEPAPCHAWVHPWIPHLELQQVYKTVRRKLGSALARWQTARAGADYHMAVPWKDALGPAVWGEFVEQTVVPYLREGLRELQVAPPDQDGGAFRGVMRWASVVESRDMARLLDEEFFAKWLDALCRWLLAERPDVEEAVAWHQGWKRLLTPELLADERVRVSLEAGLVMISRSAQGLEISGPGLRWDQHAGRTHPCRYRSRRRVRGWPRASATRNRVAMDGNE